MKPSGEWNCECIDKVLDKLAEKNTTFDTCLTTDGVYLKLAVQKINTRKRGKPYNVVLHNKFCPFCGQKTGNLEDEK